MPVTSARATALSKELFQIWHQRASLAKQHTSQWNGFTIRPVQFKDVKKIADFSERPEFAGLACRTYEQVQQAVVKSYDDFKTYGAGFYVAHDDGHLAATAVISRGSSFGDFGAENPELQFVRVGEEYQGRGLGTHLYELVLSNTFKKMPNATISAHVSVGNTASERLCEKMGFLQLAVHEFKPEDIPVWIKLNGTPNLTIATYLVNKDGFERRQ